MTVSVPKDLRVLLVDDDADVRDLVQMFLENQTHVVETRSDGKTGLEALVSSSFDIVVTDIHMAGINGFELVREARVCRPEIGIVLMTAYEDRYPVSEALSVGADGYISKPFSLNKFSMIFYRACDNMLGRLGRLHKAGAPGVIGDTFGI